MDFFLTAYALFYITQICSLYTMIDHFVQYLNIADQCYIFFVSYNPLSVTHTLTRAE